MQREYTPLLGRRDGLLRIHIHETVLVAESAADRRSHYIHSHSAEEAFYVLEGTAKFFSPDGDRVVTPGEVIHFPARTAHGDFEMLGDRLRYLVIRTIEDDDPPCCCGGDR
jgi:uncharacterized cupin superfamily protein